MIIGLGNKDNRAADRAFTLIELLVVVSILAAVTAAVVACLAAGIRVWETASVVGVRERELFSAAEIVRKDLVNIATFPGIPFEGTVAMMRFHTKVAGVWQADESGPGDQWQNGHLGEAVFQVDGNTGNFCRMRRRAVQGTEDWQDVEVLAGGIARVVFGYGVLKEGSVEWQDAWKDSTNIPSAVKISLFPVGGSVHSTVQTTVILHPASVE